MLLPPSPKRAAASLSSTGVSAAIHAVVLMALFATLVHAPRLARYQLPGTAQGTRLLSYYSPGGPAHASSTLALKPVPEPPPTPLAPVLHPATLAPTSTQMPSLNAETGTGSAAQSGLGQGDIRIALPRYFPHPEPDLSSLPPGTRGDIVLNAMIDEQGKIAELSLIRGLGPAVDSEVIAAVRQWTYTPAMRNGTPVRSEQELHFHYDHT